MVQDPVPIRKLDAVWPEANIRYAKQIAGLYTPVGHGILGREDVSSAFYM
jgi:hypothetical protein